MRLRESFFQRDVLSVAPELLGKQLVRQYEDGRVHYYTITETEAYRGEEDAACHARKGRTRRTEVMYQSGGVVYTYLIYGLYWLLNFVTGPENHPQAVLIRGVHEVSGPGRLGQLLQLDGSFYGESLVTSQRLWVESGKPIGNAPIELSERIGIDYADKIWRAKKWRFLLK
ncbi:DNA-3-methyladenine glycosylase [Carboxylicivirga taeanensis]|uniref:DNA-3-methyladenine glycosylase n=1 Tax=Carboxylicivirga taeanensis TaxID=1416875 RepID=UPI003F6DDF0E